MVLGRAEGASQRIRIWHFLLDLVWILPPAIHITVGSPLEHAIVPTVLALVAALVALTDFGFGLIPDRLTYPLAFLGIVLAYILDHTSLTDSVIGLAVGFATMYGIAWLGSTVAGQQAMGGGDVKLTAALGAFVGWQGLPMMVAFAAILALVAVGITALVKSYQMPRKILFGPYLCISALATYYASDVIWAYLTI